MRALQLDFHADRRKPEWPDVTLLAAGLAGALLLGVHLISVSSEIRTLETERSAVLHQADRQAPDPRLAALDARQLRAEVKQANGVLTQLALPWEALFKDIESSPQSHIALLTIEPDSDKRVIKITGEAKDFASLLGYIRFLQGKESLTGVYLRSHHIDEQVAERPVRFVLAASWVIKP